MPVSNPPIVRIPTVDSVPPPSASLDRYMRVVRRPGEPDKVYILCKQPDGSLAWVEATTLEEKG